jgi:RHS repeat-associated protein
VRTLGNGYGMVTDKVRQKFTGKERDNETGLDYFEARYYGSLYGRFTSPDEFTGGPDELYDFAEVAADNPTFYAELDEPQSLNKYQYCYNNPINNVDPDGHGVIGKFIKVAVKVAKTGDAAAAFVDNVNDAKTLVSSDASTGDRVAAGLSLASEVLPVSFGDLKDTYKGLKAGLNKAEEFIGTFGHHRDLQKVVAGANGKIQSHHIIQEATVKPLPGYVPGNAPAIVLQGPSIIRETQHGKTRKVQKQRGGGTYAAERRIGYKALRKAGLKPEHARKQIEEAVKYFGSIGVTGSTQTNVPKKDRAKP